MSTTTTRHDSWTCNNTAGTIYFKYRYRLSGTTTWSSVTTTGDTIAVSGLLIDRLYDFQIVNINNADNGSTAVYQGINITDPEPVFFTTNSTIEAEWNNLSEDIDSYTLTIAAFSSPGSIIETIVVTPEDTMTALFEDLSPLTVYTITLTPAANQFFTTYTYTATTDAYALCAAPIDVTATLS